MYIYIYIYIYIKNKGKKGSKIDIVLCDGSFAPFFSFSVTFLLTFPSFYILIFSRLFYLFPQLLNFRKTHFRSDEVLFSIKNEILLNPLPVLVSLIFIITYLPKSTIPPYICVFFVTTIFCYENINTTKYHQKKQSFLTDGVLSVVNERNSFKKELRKTLKTI